MTLSDEAIYSTLHSAIIQVGPDRVRQILAELVSKGVDEESTLTIVSNAGVHHLPQEYYRGEVYIASHGSLDFSTPQTIHDSFHHVLSRLAVKLKSKEWQRVYIVPFGPTVLAMQIKLLVFRVCGIESVDVMHVGGGPRADVSIDLRQLIIDSSPEVKHIPLP